MPGQPGPAHAWGRTSICFFRCSGAFPCSGATRAVTWVRADPPFLLTLALKAESGSPGVVSASSSGPAARMQPGDGRRGGRRPASPGGGGRSRRAAGCCRGISPASQEGLENLTEGAGARSEQAHPEAVPTDTELAAPRPTETREILSDHKYSPPPQKNHRRAGAPSGAGPGGVRGVWKAEAVEGSRGGGCPDAHPTAGDTSPSSSSALWSSPPASPQVMGAVG